jgi:predicted metal-dependent hydrolase
MFAWLTRRKTPFKTHHLQLDKLTVEVVHKPIKSLRLTVHRSTGKVRLSVPLRISMTEIRQFLTERRDWIRHHQTAQRPTPLHYVTGETHYFQGRGYRLNVIEHNGAQGVVQQVDSLDLCVRPASDADQRAAVLSAWYRAQLQAQLPALIAHWQPIMGVQVAEWRIKKMQTKWGTCNTRAHRIWLNLELAKHPPICLEYVVVHEMTHLLEPSHNARFKTLMDQFMPQWRERKKALNSVYPN